MGLKNYRTVEIQRSYRYCSLEEGAGILPSNHTSRDGHEHVLLTGVKNSGRALNWIQGVKYCVQEKESVAPIYPQEKETVHWITYALLFPGERNCFEENWHCAMCTTVLRRRKPVLYCFRENWYTTVLRRRKPVLYCFRENWYTTVLRRRKPVLYCFEGN